MVLNKQELERLIQEEKLVTGLCDLQTQLTPNGVDLTAGKIFSFTSQGSLDFSNKERVLSEIQGVASSKSDAQERWGWWDLPPGMYKIVANETIRLPHDMVALASPRSSLLRMGAFTQTGVWDAGFQGKSEFVLVVGNPCGVRIKQNARIVQLVFMRMADKVKHGYSGIYQEDSEGGV